MEKKKKNIYDESLSKKPLIDNEEKEEKEGKDEKKEIHSKSTVFVSTLPFDTTAEELETFFSEIGPLKSCFIVKDKVTKKHSGCGYVQFALAADAKRAITDLKKKKFKNTRTLKIVPAIRKSVVLERRENNIPINLELIKEKQAKDLQKVIDKKNKLLEPLGKDIETQKLFNSVTILLSDLPLVTKAVLYKKVRKFGSVKELIVHEPDNNLLQNEAKVVYDLKSEAQNAVKHLNDHIYKGAKIKCKLIETVTLASLAKKCRLIIRNLAFNCKPANLQNVFEVYGELVEVKVPLKDGKARGFGFVQFKNIESAQKAIDQANGSIILNRPVAVDWALGKAQFERIAKEVDESDQEIDDEASNNGHVSIIDEVDEIVVENDQENYIDAEKSTIFVRNLSFDTTKTSLYKCFEKWGKLRYALITIDKITNLSKGNGFVCFDKLDDAEKCLADYENAQFSINQAGIGQADLEETKEKKKSILVPFLPSANSEEYSKFMIDSRFVNITPAVTRSIAEKITQSSTLSRRASDKRHLYLMREGVIFPNTPAALKLSPEELEQRVAQFANRKRLLETNPNLFISRTRLSIRGLHHLLTDNHLRHACKQAVRGFWQDVHEKLREPLEPEIIEEEKAEGLAEPSFNRKIWIKQAKVIRETDRIDPVTKKPKSKGYGFVEFTSHADAIACLRYMNGNSDLFAKIVEQEFKDVKVADKGKKLIVEFSVENKLVLKKREQRNKGALDAKGEKSSIQKRKTTSDAEQSAKRIKVDKIQDGPTAETKQEPKVEKKSKKSKLTFSEKRALRRAKEKENYKKEQAKKDPEQFKGQKHETKSIDRNTTIKSAISQKSRNEQSIQKSERQRPSKREIKRIKKNLDEEKFQDLVKGFKKKMLVPEVSAKAKSKWYS